MNVLLTLIWKEYRSNVNLIVAGLILFFLPTLIVVLMSGSDERATTADVVAAALVFGALAGVILSQFMMLCLGGHLICGERSTRTFEFLFNQPISRRRIVSAKLMFVLIWKAAVWSLGGLMILTGFMLAQPGAEPSMDGVTLEFFAEVASFGAFLFGASWLASSKVDSSVLAMAIGLVMIAILFAVFRILESRIGFVEKLGDEQWVRILVLITLAAISTLWGSIVFMRRKSP